MSRGLGTRWLEFESAGGIELLRDLRVSKGEYRAWSTLFGGSRWLLTIRNIMATIMTLKKIEDYLIPHGKDNNAR